ncbi:MAG: hypothetical protein VW810_00095 [Pelagibacteraceae bacterium]
MVNTKKIHSRWIGKLEPALWPGNVQATGSRPTEDQAQAWSKQQATSDKLKGAS